MEIKTAEELEQLTISLESENFIYSKIYKSDKYFIKKETSKSYSISDEEFYRGNLSFINKKWKVEASFFDVDYEEYFPTLQLALDFIIEKARTDLIRIRF